MIISPVQLLRIAPRCPDTIAWTAALNEAMREFGIESTLQAAHWLAQLAHESTEFSRLVENLNYTDPVRIARIFRSSFDLDGDDVIDPEEIEFARGFVRSPILLANRAYAGKHGNGSESSGDGWRYRARGPIGLTFKGNYARAGQALGLPLVEQPEIVMDPDVGARVAAWYWIDRRIGPLADADDLRAVTRKINPGLAGLEDRRRYLQTAKRVLA